MMMRIKAVTRSLHSKKDLQQFVILNYPSLKSREIEREDPPNYLSGKFTICDLRPPKKPSGRNYDLMNVQFPLDPYGNPESSIPVLSCYPV